MRGIIIAALFVWVIQGLSGPVRVEQVLMGLIALNGFLLLTPPYIIWFNRLRIYLFTFLADALKAIIPALLGLGIGWVIAIVRNTSVQFMTAGMGAATGLFMTEWVGHIRLRSMITILRSNHMPSDELRKNRRIINFINVVNVTVTTLCAVGFGPIGLLIATAVLLVWGGSYAMAIPRIVDGDIDDAEPLQAD